MRAEVVEQTAVVEQPAVSDPTAATLEEALPAGPPPGPPVEPPPDRELWPWLLALLLGVLATIAVVYFATRDDGKPARQATTQAPVQPTTVAATPTTTAARTRAPSARVTVPRLIGLSAPAALTRLRRLGLTAGTENVFSPKPANVVVAQTPAASRKLAKGETVMLKVSKGPDAVAIPDVIGQTATDALRTLRAEALKPRVVRVPSAQPANQVLAQHPKAGSKAPPGTGVRLNVSDGSALTETAGSSTPTTTVAATTAQETRPSAAPANPTSLVEVPELEGKKLIDARRLVRRVGLVIEIRRVPNAQPLGTVISQAKKPGTQVKRGTHLLVTVSTGPRPSTSTTTPQSGSQSVAVPDVTGEDETTATQDLEDAGLTVRVVDRDTADATQDGAVIQQTPAAGDSVRPNSSVTIFVGRYTGA